MIKYFLVLTLPSIIKYLYDYINGNSKGPIPLPILGNLIFLLKDYKNRINRFTQLTNEFGNACQVYIPSLRGFTRWIFINDVPSIKHILKDNFNNYPKGDEFYTIFKDLLGNGIFNVDGCVWSSQRKISSYKFNIKSLRENMITVFVKHADDTIQQIKNSEQSQFDMKKYLYNYTLASIFEIGFGEDLQNISNHVEFSNSFDTVQPLFEYRFINPFWKLQKLFNIGSEAKIKYHMKLINQTLYKIINNKKFSGNDILSQFIKHDYITKIQLRDIMINFLIAGRDTTASLLNRSYYIILSNLKYKNIILDEWKEYKNFEYKTISNLKYLKAFLYECIRLYPPVPKNSKIAINDDILPDGKKIFANDRIIFSPYNIGHSEDHWVNSKEFRPERWLNEESNNKNSYKFLGFNAGYRTCLGKNMAILEASIMLIKLLQNLDLKLVDNKIEDKHGLLLDIDQLIVH